MSCAPLVAAKRVDITAFTQPLDAVLTSQAERASLTQANQQVDALFR